jgi:hypothetical protein
MSDDSESFGNSNRNRNRNRDKKKSCNGKNSNSNSDFISMFSDLFNSINYKVAIFLFILGILIFSDVFIETFLTPISGAVDGDVPTTKGTTVQLLILTLGYIIIDLMISGNLI